MKSSRATLYDNERTKKWTNKFEEYRITNCQRIWNMGLNRFVYFNVYIFTVYILNYIYRYTVYIYIYISEAMFPPIHFCICSVVRPWQSERRYGWMLTLDSRRFRQQISEPLRFLVIFWCILYTVGLESFQSFLFLWKTPTVSLRWGPIFCSNWSRFLGKLTCAYSSRVDIKMQQLQEFSGFASVVNHHAADFGLGTIFS